MLRVYERNNQKSAIQFMDYVLEKLPFRVECVQTDNNAEFQGGFHWHLLDRGVGHVYIRPRTPRLNGKVERCHRIDAEEFYRLLDGVVIDDTGLFNEKLREWEDFYSQGRTSAEGRQQEGRLNLVTRNDPAGGLMSSGRAPGEVRQERGPQHRCPPSTCGQERTRPRCP